MRTFLKIVLAIFVIAIIAFLLGPKPDFDPFDNKIEQIEIPLNQLDSFVVERESKVADLKAGCEAKIIWNDTIPSKTKFSIVYLHGFSATHEEGAPIHTDFAKRYGCNLYLSRLYDHGRLDSNTFRGMTPNQLLESAEEALSIGSAIGEKVIVMSCSTGGTMDVALSHLYSNIAAHIMYSPNIEIADPSSKMVTMPWGKNLMTAVMGGEHTHIDYNDLAKQYWAESYHTDGIVALQTILDDYMVEENFNKIDEPLFLGCYYKDEEHQDNVVSVDAMRDFFEHIGTTSDKKRFMEFPKAGSHVISSHVFSGDLEGVKSATYKFAEDVLKLSPVGE